MPAMMPTAGRARGSTLAWQLERRRRALGLSVSQLGALAGYHENTVLRALHGRNVRLQTFQDVAGALGLSVGLIRIARGGGSQDNALRPTAAGPMM